jgi:Secretion system C-terminal sorting domain/Metallo-peptidase family M12B Reprolysin-like
MRQKITVAIVTLLGVFYSKNLTAQDCHQAMSAEQADSLVLQKVISMGIISPEEARKRMVAYRNPNIRQNREIKVLFVTQRFTQTNLNLAAAQNFLRQCAKGSNACEVTYVRINEVAIAYVWSEDATKALQSWIDLGAAAINQNWYAQADIVVGITNDAFTDYGGYATIDQDCQPPYRGRIVIKSGSSNSLFAHELGHTLGMIHDDTPINIANSVMLPFVPGNPTTMSETNRNCYYKNTNSNTACTTPTNEIDALNIKFSPNPVNDRLNIDINNAVKVDEISLYNVLGNKIFSINNPTENMYIDFTNYQNGLYFLKMKSDNRDYVSKIVKH